MTTTSNADRAILDWLATERGSLAADTVENAIATARTVRQRHGLRAALVGSGSWPAHRTIRLSKLPPSLRVALALALATALLFGGLLSVGMLVPDPPVDAPVDPSGYVGDWLNYLPDGLSFGGPSGPSRLSLHLPVAGNRAFVRLSSMPNMLLSSMIDSPSSAILSFSTTFPIPVDGSPLQGDAVFVDGVLLEPCVEDDEGRYQTILSADGLELTLIAESDACDSRRAVFERTWLRSFDSTTRGGRAAVSGFIDLFSLTLPPGDYEVTRLPSLFIARGTLTSGLPLTVFVLRNPRDELGRSCTDPWAPGDEIGLGRESILTFMRHRFAVVGAMPDERHDRSIGGFNAIHAAFLRGCGDDATVLWGEGDDQAYRIGQPEGQAASLWFIDRRSDLWVVGTLESTSTGNYPESNREGEILDSIEWIPNPFFGEVPS